MVSSANLGRIAIATGCALVLAACGSDDQQPPNPNINQLGQPQQAQPQQVQPGVQPQQVQPGVQQMQPPPAMPMAGNGPPVVMDPPAMDPPAMDPPAMDPPAMDPPAMDPPAMDPPAMDPPAMGDGACCSDGDCYCHGEDPGGLTSDNGPYNVDTYSVSAGCIYYPTDAEGPLAAMTVSDGFLGSGGCGITQTNGWGPLLASWGIVTMIINTTGSDQPNVRGRKLGTGVEAFKAENTKSGGELEGKLGGRYGTAGFSMGGGGTSYASAADPSLKSSIAIMPWGPTRESITVPTLVICGSSDGIASCGSHGTPLYGRIGNSTPKMRVTVSSGHSGQPSAGRNESGKAGLAFAKAFLEGDERWLPHLKSASTINDSNL